ncbi:hypothetical protein ACIP5Y_38845 [Nocardia sp. NPDC088792]|uniref:hypothetical protein n=1 Tax=Nocardia sp. NPDC088792 TaxID=3364332 RepID=UPI00381295D5
MTTDVSALIALTETRHTHCDDPAPMFDSAAEAELVRRVHAGHGPGCVQSAAAKAFCDAFRTA